MGSALTVYLPYQEAFSASHGGALATWTHEVYSRLTLHMDVSVVARRTETPYPVLPLAPCAPNRLSLWLAQTLQYRSLLGALEPCKLFLRRSYSRHAAVICQRLGAGIVHIHNDPEAVVPIRRRNPAATLLLHMNNDHLIEGDPAPCASSAVQAADRIVFCSRYLLEGALKTVPGLRPERCSVVYNGARLGPRPLLPAQGFKSPTGPVILFVGRIVRQKGLHVLLAAMTQVLQRFPSATLKIVGGVAFGSSQIDPYLAQLHNQAAALGGHVEFVGPVSHTQIEASFQSADVFVCPSIWNEPLGMVNLEAMGAGVPVVAFARGGIPEALGQAGLLVQAPEPDALSAALLRVLADGALRQELALKGWERVAARFSWEVIAAQWQACLPRGGGRGEPQAPEVRCCYV